MKDGFWDWDDVDRMEYMLQMILEAVNLYRLPRADSLSVFVPPFDPEPEKPGELIEPNLWALAEKLSKKISKIPCNFLFPVL